MAFYQVTKDQLGTDLVKYSEANYPKTAKLYNSIKLWLANINNPNWNFKFYVYDGHISDSESTFVVVINEMVNCILPSTTVAIYPPENTNEAMKSAFIDMVNWKTERLDFYICRESFVPTLVEIIQKMAGKNARQCPCYEYSKKPSEESQRFDIANELRNLNQNRDSPFTFKNPIPLTELNTIAKQWNMDLHESCDEDSTVFKSRKQFIQIALESNCCHSVALYCNEVIIGWIFTSVIGTCNALHVKEEYRHQGLAQLIVNILYKLNSENERNSLYTIAHTIEGNPKGKKLFEKLGFICSGKVVWF